MTTPRNQILVGDALSLLATLPPESVDCAVTSPPYYLLRDYGVAGQLGQERHVDEWVAGLRDVSRALWRVLVPTGSLWLNLSDSYSTHRRYGARPKSLLLGPERVARTLLEDGWIVRNKVIWHKSNPLPSPVRDRLTTTYEVVYFLTKRPSAFFDLDAIRVPLKSTGKPSASPARRVRPWDGWLGRAADWCGWRATDGTAPTWQEPRRRVDDRREPPSGRPLRHLSASACASPAAGDLPASRLHALSAPVAAKHSAGHLPRRRSAAASA
jgi:hypothetical protein